MNIIYQAVTALALAVMACTSTVNAPAPTQTQILATANTVKAVNTPYAVEVLGEDTTWNIREGASLEHPVIGIAYGGDRFVILSMYGGWVQTEAGWICGQAFGASDRCE